MKKDDEKQVKEGIKILKATAARLGEREKKLKSSPAVQLTYIKSSTEKVRDIQPVLLSGVSKGACPLAHDFACKV